MIKSHKVSVSFYLVWHLNSLLCRSRRLRDLSTQQLWLSIEYQKLVNGNCSLPSIVRHVPVC